MKKCVNCGQNDAKADSVICQACENSAAGLPKEFADQVKEYGRMMKESMDKCEAACGVGSGCVKIGNCMAHAPGCKNGIGSHF
jgi:hypothetical protein